MWQLFKPLTERKYLQKELDNERAMRDMMMRDQGKINAMIISNDFMIQQLEKKLENMK